MRINFPFRRPACLLSFLFAVTGFFGVCAQELTLSITPQYGSYKMSDLKDLQSEQAKNISDSLNTTPKTIYDFPSYWGFRINTSYFLKRHKYSLNVGHNVTGGRVHYGDYSGQIKIDKQMSCINFSLAYSYAILNAKRFKITTGIGFGTAFSTLATDNTVEIYVSEEKTQQTVEYHSRQLFINPEASLYYSPVKFLFVELTAGYHKQLSSSEMLFNKRGEEVVPDWSGFRIGAGIGFKINLTK